MPLVPDPSGHRIHSQVSVGIPWGLTTCVHTQAWLVCTWCLQVVPPLLSHQLSVRGPVSCLQGTAVSVRHLRLPLQLRSTADVKAVSCCSVLWQECLPLWVYVQLVGPQTHTPSAQITHMGYRETLLSV